MNFHALASDFGTYFSREADRFFFSPGRINLMGEHTDYNGGHMLPVTINYGTYGAVSKRNDRTVRLYWKNDTKQGKLEFTLDELDFDSNHAWANFPKGMLKYLQKTENPLQVGFDLLLANNLPNQEDFATSAALLMLTGKIVRNLYNINLTRSDIIKIGLEVETEFIGDRSKIVDLYPIAIGKMNHALLVDSHSLQFEYIPLELKNYKIIIMDTNRRSKNAVLKYQQRRDECEHALRHLQGALNIHSLGDLNLAQFENFMELIPTNLLKKRARHVITENERALNAAKALKRGDFVTFGKLLNQSHLSLRNDYEITGTELDTLVEAAWQQTGVLGAKMIGSGLGGCAIAFVEETEVNRIIDKVAEIYHHRIGANASFYQVAPIDGVKELTVGCGNSISK